jgi:hypothetical protein
MITSNIVVACYDFRGESGAWEVGELGSYERSARCHGMYTISHLSIFHKGFLSCLCVLDWEKKKKRG